MKVRIQKDQNSRKSRVIDVAVSGNMIERFNDSMDQLDDVLVGRSEEIEALKLCLLTGSHLMLEGKHGIAKSLLADEAFKRITGARVFKKQFMKGTQPDEVLGPMNAKKYRDEAIWEHNITGMLPDCDFFYGDEIYRASDQALPLMMGILNEGEFINGGKVIKCPLMTAIGTTNFITDSEELEAFHDRWQVRVKSEALSSPSDVRLMLARALKRDVPKLKTITLDEIKSLNRGIRNINVPDEILEIIPEIYARFSSSVQNIYISDRRKVQALKFMQAYALLAGKNEVEPEHIEGSRFAISLVRDSAQGQAWANVSSTLIGEMEQMKAEGKTLRKLEKMVKNLEGNYDPSKPVKELKKIYDEAKQLLTAIKASGPDTLPTSQQGVRRLDVVNRKLEELIQELTVKNTF
jgi:MoxR-like ATPase